MAHPEDRGRCVLDSYFECPAIVAEACICAKMPPGMRLERQMRKYGEPKSPHPDDHGQ